MGGGGQDISKRRALSNVIPGPIHSNFCLTGLSDCQQCRMKSLCSPDLQYDRAVLLHDFTDIPTVTARANTFCQP